MAEGANNIKTKLMISTEFMLEVFEIFRHLKYSQWHVVWGISETIPQ